ncbi:nuclear transport factor 2 family protein [Kribbella sp. NPDC051952]|uniref:nuclear transport factor 2 family protein n=1 Tax=Kribbella sp. NPDC051952 TaxID=3154851 RepID=UPI003420ACB3
MSASLPNVTVLGLGRMGTAIADRLAGQGWEVTGWNRTPVSAAGSITLAADPADAVAKAEIVVLALYDGPACREVISRIKPALRPDSLIVNTSTIAPAEAAALSSDLGASYLHAPVLGSVPAVTSGSLTILVGGQPARSVDVLASLGRIETVGDAATAAALKLIANSSLAGVVSALRESLQQAAALGVPRDRALDILALGQLGGLVTRKRQVLLGEATPTQFTIGALAKDADLLSTASGYPLPYAAELAESAADPDADIALAATVPPVDAAVLAPLNAYIRGHATGDPAHFRAAFLPSAHIEGIRAGAFVSWDLEQYCAKFDGTPAPDEASRRRRIDSVEVHGTVATASMTLWHGPDTFKDIFLLVHTPTGWHIANKAYARS